MEARTFREAYGVLQEHAETLREQAEPNIDNLLSIVTEPVAAYKVCKERIDAVEKALQGRTGAYPAGGEEGVSLESTTRRPTVRPAAEPSAGGLNDMDDDVLR